MSIFKKKEPPLPPGKKLALYNITDYPKALYSAYPEIGVNNTAPFKWRARMLSYEHGIVVAETQGEAESEHEARRASQTWVLEQFERCLRPLPPTVENGGIA